MYIHICHTHPDNWNTPCCYSITAAFNYCYSELMPYTALANCYGVSAYDACQYKEPRPLTTMTIVAI